MSDLKGTSPSPQKVRCAIYTRKSTEEGLDQQFNSLEAQREACEAFVTSQAHLGWCSMKDAFDDGGFSGGNLDRPALKRLLELVRFQQVDVIVVHRIDRLSRSLLDFTKLVDFLEERGVAFVSVTQQFNTQTSMGRLVLNMLLSFAQFERELTAERIRDKVAATKRKGLFCGGIPPLGYDLDSATKVLRVNEQEADVVRFIFARFLELRSPTLLTAELNDAGMVTKRHVSKKGKVTGGRTWVKQDLYKILRNPTYLGRIPHKGDTFEGKHPAIMDQSTWDRAQRLLPAPQRLPNAQNRPSGRHKALLGGLVRCGVCNRAMSPSSSCKKGKGIRYRYYLCARAAKEHHQRCSLRSIPAHTLEEAVAGEVRKVLRDPAILPVTSGSLSHLPRLESTWEALFAPERRRLLHTLLSRVTVYPHHLDLDFDLEGLVAINKEMETSSMGRSA